MSDTNYTYAVARTRAMEISLFSRKTIDQLLGCSTKEQCMQFLNERKWGSGEITTNAEEMLSAEKEKTVGFIGSLVEDLSVFGVLFYPDIFHNLKAAIKKAVIGEIQGELFIPETKPSGEEIFSLVNSRDFSSLPAYMEEAAKQAYEELVHTGDGQLCDIMIDRATLQAIYESGMASNEEIVKNYAEIAVALANIKIAVRASKTGKSASFMEQAMYPCESLDINELKRAAAKGEESIQKYLEGTKYAGGAEALKKSPSAFECWCDNQVIALIQPQISNPFTIGPLMAYLLARENEIKTVRIILSGKQNGLSEDSIRERVREMYV